MSISIISSWNQIICWSSFFSIAGFMNLSDFLPIYPGHQETTVEVLKSLSFILNIFWKPRFSITWMMFPASTYNCCTSHKVEWEKIQQVSWTKCLLRRSLWYALGQMEYIDLFGRIQPPGARWRECISCISTLIPLISKCAGLDRNCTWQQDLN